MKKLKEVTDKKKTSLLKTIDEKLTEAAGELGLSLEQRTVRMKQRGKKVRVPYGSLCRFRLEGGGGGFPLSFPAHLHLLPSPPEESCPTSRRAGSRVARGWTGRVLQVWQALDGAPFLWLQSSGQASPVSL